MCSCIPMVSYPGDQCLGIEDEVWTVFGEESDCSGPRPPKLSLDQVLFRKNVKQ